MANVFSEGEQAIQASDGARIFFRTIGEGATTLLFLHGWGGSGSGSFWNPVLRHLEKDRIRLVLVDLRGHGRSEHTRHGFTTERFAQDMFEVADHLGVAELIVVAYSMSGRWAQWMACSDPQRVRGQVLIAPAPAAALPLTGEMVDDWIRTTRTRTACDGFVRQFTKNELASDIVDGYFASIQSSPEYSLRESLRMCCDAAFADRLTAVRAATLVVGGEHDPILVPDYLRQEVVQKIPEARLVLLDCGHEIPLERPREAAALIEAFLAGCSTGGL